MARTSIERRWTGRGRETRLVLLALLAGWAGGVSAEVPAMPTMTPVPPSGQPPLSSATRATNPGTEFIDLEKAGYVEEEYYMSGVAPVITAQGATLFQAPYITRILVRKPKDPRKFNGTVVIEPFTWIGERGAGWILTKDYLVRKGYGWVGYTLNINKPAKDPKTTTDPDWQPDPEPQDLNFDFMRRFDYARYAPLGSYYDPARFQRGGHADPFVPQSQGIGAQLALALKSNLLTGPMRGLQVKRVYVDSWAVTAQIWMDYLDQGRHQQWRMPDGRPLVDAYMTGKMSFGEVGGPAIRTPRHMPADAPFVTVYSESEAMHDAIEGIDLPADSDRPPLRYYEVAGMSHLRLADLGTEEVEDLPADVGRQNDPRCQHLYDEPAQMVVSALFDDMDRWVRDGKPMPRAPHFTRKGRGIARDPLTGNMIGGVRPPWIEAPVATYLTDQETGCGMVYDTKVPYSRDKLRTLYGSFDGYAAKFKAAEKEAETQGYLLPADAAELAPIAKPDDF